MSESAPRVYLVGGAVRDALLARWRGDAVPTADRDWVVVGSTPQAMIDQGYTPVGRDFPVFLHPVSSEEYALARTERKTAAGYHGFVFHADPAVTLEQDLMRRDLSINALALPAQRWGKDWSEDEVIDVCGGLADLRAGVLRHVSAAFDQDPVRILRLARFAARWPHMRVAASTLGLMRNMVDAGEVAALVAERVWQELARGLMTPQPSRMFNTLRDCGALRVLLPELDRLWGVPQRADLHPEIDTGIHTMMVVDAAASAQASLAVRFACLCHDLGKGTTPQHLLPRHLGHEGRSVALVRALAARWRVPKDLLALAEVVAREHGNIHRSAELDAAAVLRLLLRGDALRRPQRWSEILLACACDARGHRGFEDQDYAPSRRLQRALEAAQSVDAAAIAARIGAQSAASGAVGQAIAEAVQAAQLQAIDQWLSSGC